MCLSWIAATTLDIRPDRAAGSRAGAAHGKGRGKEVIAVARTADLVLIVLDAGKEGVNDHKRILERELETVGLRLNKRPPNIYLVKKATGGVKFNATVPLTKLGDDPAKTVNSILHESVRRRLTRPGFAATIGTAGRGGAAAGTRTVRGSR